MKIKKLVKRIIPKKIKNKFKQRELDLIRRNLKNTECKYKIYQDEIKKMEGKIAIITGGSGAIGSATAFKLAMEGATVIVAGRNINNLTSVVKQITSNGGKAEALELDVTNWNSINTCFDKIIDKYGKIDILANIAGGSARSRHSDIVDQKIEVIDEIININLRGTILCCKKVASYMKKNKYGRIINIGSTVGIGGLSGFSEYCASKAGIIGFTKSLAMELAKNNITVNCVTPGITYQLLWDKPLDDYKTNNTYIGRIGKTDDIANAVEFFCRDESNYIIGQNLIVDGGRSLGLKN